ncbi:MAG: serine/threonine-protein kinase [Actinomycetota bacterium]
MRSSDRVLQARYRLGPLLGRGGMAEVYDGYDERLHRPVAVKLLRPDMAADPDVRSRFEVEARAAAGLSHPNVVAVFDTGEDEGTPFIVMERLPGQTLADRMASGPLDQDWLRRMAGDVLAALGAAHAAGVIHRDVKPGNILISEDGRAKVADFGIAKSAEVAMHSTGTGLLVGTPAYLAPERVEGQPATARSDLYALGVVLYEALVGAKPYEGETAVATAHAVLHQRHRPLVEARPGVDPALAAAVERALERDPSRRPASAREMAREVRAVAPAAGPDATVTLSAPDAGADRTLVGAPLMAPAPAPAGVRPRPVARSRPAPGTIALVAGAALLAAVLLAAVLQGGGPGADGSAGELAADLRELAGRVQNGDGPKGPEAAERLAVVADQVEAGGGSHEGNALLADAGAWNAAGLLSDTATTRMTDVLGRIDGVDTSLVTTTTTTTAAPLLPLFSGDGDDREDHDEEEDGRKGRKGKRD